MGAGGKKDSMAPGKPFLEWSISNNEPEFTENAPSQAAACGFLVLAEKCAPEKRPHVMIPLYGRHNTRPNK
jgi:hypothetical protein